MSTVTVNRAARGFTIIELLVVISIMAVIATLATGAAIKAVKQGREKRISATIKTLESALQAYRSRENKWPFQVNQLTKDPGNNDQYNTAKLYWSHGEDNYKVFGDLYPQKGSTGKTVYLDASSVLTKGRKTLLAAIEDGKSNVPLGYPDPDHSDRFHCFCVQYNARTDSVKVYRQDKKHDDRFWCPNLKTEWQR